MARNRAIVRPWVQAFYLNVRYDRQYYNSEYVQKQIFGVRDSADRGYMYWNNSGDYSTILPDVSAEDPYIGTAPEAGTQFRKPAVGTQKAPEYNDEMVSVLDMLYSRFDGRQKLMTDSGYTPLLKVRPLVK